MFLLFDDVIWDDEGWVLRFNLVNIILFEVVVIIL